ncbi:hypothetical protein GT370_19490 [Acidocella sp. MX-AZ03]|uniref:hypothetical protein n=1 Tax=Acidocella sp. MX-AZ03 TaxID=2697363 RepID=UPI0022DD50F8|nr:hypothetical protein [Acidocella sp. MX-AZ03]WBO59200.1 hypothetical protein GT370_19490 [Acidocella sp. MX-AZ03]
MNDGATILFAFFESLVHDAALSTTPKMCAVKRGRSALFRNGVWIRYGTAELRGAVQTGKTEASPVQNPGIKCETE